MGFEREVSKFERKNLDGLPVEFTPEETERNRRNHRKAIKDAQEELARRGPHLVNPKIVAHREERDRQAKLGVDRAHGGCDAGEPR